MLEKLHYLRQNYWMKVLRTIYPSGLNKIGRKHDSEAPVGKLFFSIRRTKQQSARYRKNNYYLKNNTITDFYKHS